MTNTQNTLKAQKFTNEKFVVTNGYVMFTSEWGVKNTLTGEWVTMGSSMPYSALVLPYAPRGGRKACKMVADECNPSELSYISAM